MATAQKGSSMNHYEPDSIQCTALRKDGKRCSRTGKFSNGGGVLCLEHQRFLLEKISSSKDAAYEKLKGENHET